MPAPIFVVRFYIPVDIDVRLFKCECEQFLISLCLVHLMESMYLGNTVECILVIKTSTHAIFDRLHGIVCILLAVILIICDAIEYDILYSSSQLRAS